MGFDCGMGAIHPHATTWVSFAAPLFKGAAFLESEVMPGFNSYSSIDSFPSLETLGLRSGQDPRIAYSWRFPMEPLREIDPAILGSRIGYQLALTSS